MFALISGALCARQVLKSSALVDEIVYVVFAAWQFLID